MRADEWSGLAARVVEPLGSTLTLSGSLVHEPHPTTLLRGLAKDSSGFSTGFAVWAFVQPLGIPADHLFFSYGRRLRRPDTNEEWWSADPGRRDDVVGDLRAAVTAQAVPLLNRLGTPQGLLDHIEGMPTWAVDPNHLEAAACCVVELDDRPRALAIRAHLHRTPWAPGWQQEVAVRATRLVDALIDDPAAARRRLHRTSAATAAALGVPGDHRGA